ncbi:unnamed protein product [Linum tenue]|uniref:Uncharacterized protein n=1 Tax=Linum tenue TaxID=586396 RepID=A0AAV0IZS7_9ROSI|nr:unnamed protein product [Linum tenue]
MVTVRMIDITVNFTDGMFRGTYNGKQHHVADIPAVLTRAWNASLSSGMKIFAFDFSCSVWSSPNMFAIEYLSVASRKFLLPTVSSVGLAIAETDGRLFCTVGVHPTRCKVDFKLLHILYRRSSHSPPSCSPLIHSLGFMQEFEESGDPENHFQALLSLAKEGIRKGKVVAVGECGLDYDRLHFCPAEIQKKLSSWISHSMHFDTLPNHCD